MRILIDECLDWRLCRFVGEHQCASVHQMGWEGLPNGMLLEKAQEQFDVLITADTNLRFQQNVTKYNLAVVVLEAQSTRLLDTAKLMPSVLRVLQSIQPGEVRRITLR